MSWVTDRRAKAQNPAGTRHGEWSLREARLPQSSPEGSGTTTQQGWERLYTRCISPRVGTR